MLKGLSSTQRMFLPLVLLAVTAYWLHSSCIKPPDYPDAPVIAFNYLSKNEMMQGRQREDSLTVSFTYTDGDGDLGFKEADAPVSIFVKDTRDTNLVRTYKLPYVEPQGTGNGINGDISIVVPTTCCIFVTPEGLKLACEQLPISFDTVQYKITIRDRAGHTSNEIITPPIRLICN